MSQNTMVIADGTGATVLTEINNALDTLNSLHSGASDPGAIGAFAWWADSGNNCLKQRNSANTGWLVRAVLNDTPVSVRSAAVALQPSDNGTIILASGYATQPFVAVATLGNGWKCYFKNTGTAAITLDPNSSETIDGAATISLNPGESCQLFCDGTAIYTFGRAALLDPKAFYKADSQTPAFVKTGAGTISVKAGTYIMVAGTMVAFAAQTAIVMPALTAGTDYAIYACTDGTIRADSSWSAPSGYTTGNSRMIGGFHYGLVASGTTVASGSFATTGNGMIWTQTDVDNIAGINSFSIWDLKFRPVAADPRGMALVGGKTWVDIYLCSTDTAANGTSKAGSNIASGTVLPKIPAAFNGNGTTTYPTLNWWVANELARASKKRLMWEHEFVEAAFGVTENQSIDTTASTYPTTQRNAGYTSKYGIEQASGHHWTWGQDSSAYQDVAGAGSYKQVDGNTGAAGSERGQIYTFGTYGLVRVILGGARSNGAYSGSRTSYWNVFPWGSNWYVGLRAACDHMTLV